MDLFNYSRRKSRRVSVGGVSLGSGEPIRLQSMTTAPTMDTEGCVRQAEAICMAGGEIVRLTTQGVREAGNLDGIRRGLLARGRDVPLVADVHFNAGVALSAALHADKVRINPGNFYDPARKFRKVEYTDDEYREELLGIERLLVPFLETCRRRGVAVRIGANHGSLSDRIMSRYGDTPEGIVESCMEYLRICLREGFADVVVSIKSSNTVVMVRAVRLLACAMEDEGMDYPLHLGVTEAGEGEDGRIRSAVGIGALLSDGLGDTVRVSLSEAPEAEIPVARHLVDHVCRVAPHPPIPAVPSGGFDWLRPERRRTVPVGGIGGLNAPVVISTMRPGVPWGLPGDDACRPDYVYAGGALPSTGDPGRAFILDAVAFAALPDAMGAFPLFGRDCLDLMDRVDSPLKFLLVDGLEGLGDVLACLEAHPETVAVCQSGHRNRLGELRAIALSMVARGLGNPIVFRQGYRHQAGEREDFQVEAAADMGALMVDGLVDGLWLDNEGTLPQADVDSTAFSVLQAGRLRISRTEYVSCPGCGRTLYDLPGTIARIKEATKGMRGLKIGIMGCIVNGPGEMADADYGYVGAGRGRVSLYRGKDCVERNIPEELAVGRLLELIARDGRG